VKDAANYLRHILDCVYEIEMDIAGLREPLAIRQIYNSVLRVLQVMAESALQLPAEMKERHPEIQWEQLRGFRNRLVHDYLGIELRRVDEAVRFAMPLLAEMARAELALLEAPEE
jgi:uncharacterized protein with HEPN domain